MTAAAVVQSWERCQPVFRNAGGWLALLRIASFGAAGVQQGARRTRAAHKRDVPTYIDRGTVRKWQGAGLIECWSKKGQHHQLETHLKITIKGLRLLGVQPETSTNFTPIASNGGAASSGRSRLADCSANPLHPTRTV